MIKQCKNCNALQSTEDPNKQPRIFCIDCDSPELEWVSDELPFGEE